MEYDGCAIGLIGLFLLVITGLGVAVVHDARQDAKEHKHFMEQCLKDHKEYECTALWRAGEDHDNTAVIPMPIYIPSR